MATGRALNPSERLDWLRLIRTEQIGPVTFYALLQRYGSAAAALEALPRLARRCGGAQWRWSARAMPRRTVAASRAGLPRSSADAAPGSSSPPASRAESTPR